MAFGEFFSNLLKLIFFLIFLSSKPHKWLEFIADLKHYIEYLYYIVSKYLPPQWHNRIDSSAKNQQNTRIRQNDYD